MSTYFALFKKYLYICALKVITFVITLQNVTVFSATFTIESAIYIYSIIMRKIIGLFVGLSFLMCSCEEHDLGISKEVLYQKTFEQNFGPIAEGHQWGFDLAEAAFGLQNELTRAVIKMDMPISGNLLPYQVFDAAPNITDREHYEVYQWFTNHKVNWTNTPTYFDKNAFDREDETTYNVRTIQTDDGYAHYIDGSSWFVTEDDGIETYENSLLRDESNLCTTNCPLNNTIGCPHAWVQHVAHNPVGYNHMDYLQCWGLKAENDTDPHWQAHLNDANSGRGWGYGRQDDEGHYNALLVTYADVDLWSYGNSVGSSYPHDKYFIVYLKGDGYEGWYLGFDFESFGQNPNEIVAADGICNDWIIKITDIGNLILTPKFRIMCEDLGGTFDMDFNDIVYDVECSDQKVCIITMQAAGGTMPIRLQYGDHVLKKNGNEEIHKIFETRQNQPVNVKASNGINGKNPIVFKIAFSDTQSGYEQGCDLVLDIPSTEFSFHEINIYVKQDENPAEWVSIHNIEGAAPYKFVVPISETNIPKWVIELKNISLGYPSFNEWVQNPTVEFWTASDIDEDYLY